MHPKSLSKQDIQLHKSRIELLHLTPPAWKTSLTNSNRIKSTSTRSLSICKSSFSKLKTKHIKWNSWTRGCLTKCISKLLSAKETTQLVTNLSNKFTLKDQWQPSQNMVTKVQKSNQRFPFNNWTWISRNKIRLRVSILFTRIFTWPISKMISEHSTLIYIEKNKKLCN